MMETTMTRTLYVQALLKTLDTTPEPIQYHAVLADMMAHVAASFEIIEMKIYECTHPEEPPPCSPTKRN